MQKLTVNGRIIGIRHRVKQKKDESASPTIVAIADGDNLSQHNLETEQEELDFLLSNCPISYRACEPTEDLSGFPEHHLIFREAKEEDATIERHTSQCRHEKGRLIEVVSKVPDKYIGLKANDTVSMTLGGSGDYFAYALSAELATKGGSVMRIPPFKLNQYRGNAKKDGDAVLLAKLAREHAEDFYETEVRDRGIIRLRCLYRDWIDTMKARIGCEQRLFQRHIGLTFCSETGRFPEGSVQKDFEARKSNDPVLNALIAEEARADKALKQAVQSLDIWQQVFEPIPGIGHRIAARLIYSLIDIRRFEKESKICAFLGVHVLKDGTLPRRRVGANCNWHPEGRQALYLLGDQFVRQSSRTHWGNYLIARKAALQTKHPVPITVEITVNGKPKQIKRYTKGHIHKMAIWRTLTRFTEYMFREWKKVEESART